MKNECLVWFPCIKTKTTSKLEIQNVESRYSSELEKACVTNECVIVGMKWWAYAALFCL